MKGVTNRKAFPREFLKNFFSQEEFRHYASKGGLNKKTKKQFESILSEQNLWNVFEAYAQDAECKKMEQKEQKEEEMQSYSFDVNDVLYSGCRNKGYQFVYVEAITKTGKLRVRPFKQIKLEKNIIKHEPEKDGFICTTTTYRTKPDLEDMDKVKKATGLEKPDAIMLRPNGSTGSTWYSYKTFEKYDESKVLDVCIVDTGLD